MQVELNFATKVLKVGSIVNFKELTKFVKTLPEWKEWSIDANTQITYWTNPIWINPCYPTITWTNTCDLRSGYVDKLSGSSAELSDWHLTYTDNAVMQVEIGIQ